jgi:RNA polymerase sigma-70 factor (ECF subfamily)
LSGAGELVLLADQDRTLWDRRQIEEGATLLAESLQRKAPTRYAVQAALAAVHAEAATWDDTDWTEIVGLYDVLYGMWPSPVVALNRAVAVGFLDGPEAGLAALAPLQDEPALATYAYLGSARADLLRRLGRRTEAAAAYEEALALTDNDVERAFLARRLDEVRWRSR